MEIKDRQKGLAGRWRKATTTKCSEIYPDDLEFTESGTYLGEKGGGKGEFTWWDLGEYEVLAENQVKISTANDAEMVYKFSISADVLTFVDKDGCEFQYHRVKDSKAGK